MPSYACFCGTILRVLRIGQREVLRCSTHGVRYTLPAPARKGRR